MNVYRLKAPSGLLVTIIVAKDMIECINKWLEKWGPKEEIGSIELVFKDVDVATQFSRV